MHICFVRTIAHSPLWGVFILSEILCSENQRCLLVHSHFLSMHFISKYSSNDIVQSASVLHGISLCAVMKKDNKIMLLKHFFFEQIKMEYIAQK
jgi:hypothetical protein